MKILSGVLGVIFLVGLIYLFVGFAAWTLTWRILYIALLLILGAVVIGLLRKVLRSV